MLFGFIGNFQNERGINSLANDKLIEDEGFIDLKNSMRESLQQI